jgi:hypothetical protein
MQPDTKATITCPSCGTSAREDMPTNACRRVYVCQACGVRLTPKPGDCCVFCSYADTVCPPRQAGASEAAGPVPGRTALLADDSS